MESRVIFVGDKFNTIIQRSVKVSPPRSACRLAVCATITHNRDGERGGASRNFASRITKLDHRASWIEFSRPFKLFAPSHLEFMPHRNCRPQPQYLSESVLASLWMLTGSANTSHRLSSPRDAFRRPRTDRLRSVGTAHERTQMVS